uniref:Uncharacterized protein n=1 Tax=Glossina brevipalpis TaxID=37001 RepID=A0A1A9WB97_9MUSC
MEKRTKRIYLQHICTSKNAVTYAVTLLLVCIYRIVLYIWEGEVSQYFIRANMTDVNLFWQGIQAQALIGCQLYT